MARVKFVGGLTEVNHPFEALSATVGDVTGLLIGIIQTDSIELASVVYEGYGEVTSIPVELLTVVSVPEPDNSLYVAYFGEGPDPYQYLYDVGATHPRLA